MPEPQKGSTAFITVFNVLVVHPHLRCASLNLRHTEPCMLAAKSLRLTGLVSAKPAAIDQF